MAAPASVPSEACRTIILVGNHPSGDPTPSPDDVRLTEQTVQAGQLLDIEVLDHLVIGHQRYVRPKVPTRYQVPSRGPDEGWASAAEMALDRKKVLAAMGLFTYGLVALSQPT